MTTFLATLVLVVIAVVAMAVGVLFRGRPLKGSCGGVGGDCACGAGEGEACRYEKELAGK